MQVAVVLLALVAISGVVNAGPNSLSAVTMTVTGAPFSVLFNFTRTNMPMVDIVVGMGTTTCRFSGVTDNPYIVQIYETQLVTDCKFTAKNLNVNGSASAVFDGSVSVKETDTVPYILNAIAYQANVRLIRSLQVTAGTAFLLDVSNAVDVNVTQNLFIASNIVPCYLTGSDVTDLRVVGGSRVCLRQIIQSNLAKSLVLSSVQDVAVRSADGSLIISLTSPVALLSEKNGRIYNVSDMIAQKGYIDLWIVVPNVECVGCTVKSVVNLQFNASSVQRRSVEDATGVSKRSAATDSYWTTSDIGLTITAVRQSGDPTTPTDSKSSSNKALQYGLGFGLGFGLAAVCVGAALMYIKRRRGLTQRHATP